MAEGRENTFQVWTPGANGTPQPSGLTRVDMFREDAAGNTWHKWYDGQWHDWENLGQPPT